MLLQRVVELAQTHGCRSLAVTFSPHPRMALDATVPDRWLLSTQEEKFALIAQSGIDDILVLRFDRALAQMTAQEFMDEIIDGKLHARCWVAGVNHSFGKDRQGNSATHVPPSMQVDVVRLKQSDAAGRISSSTIRRLLSEGGLASANRMLGYHYTMSGKVVHGDHLGHTIGFPTANIEPEPHKLLPKEGVYCVRATVAGAAKTGMMYIGKRTIARDHECRAEVHLFDFEGDIYGQSLQVSFTHRIRDNIRFENAEQLARQLRQDKQACLHLPPHRERL
jgi:riboflavin kinase/FMN adenylyltransferase